MNGAYQDSVTSTRRSWLDSRPRQVVLLAVALALRFALFGYVSDNMKHWIIPWFDYLSEHGPAALGENIPNATGYDQLSGNYTPPYYYLLLLASQLQPWIPRLYLIKIVSVAFDLLAAFFMYRLIHLAAPRGVSPWLGVFAVLFAPTVLLNGALWGQSDVIPHSLVLGSVYFTVRRKPVAAVVCVGLAFSVKATAIFLFPYLLMLVLRAWLPWTSLFGIPLVYAAMMAPAAVLGRSAAELAGVYLSQARYFDTLSNEAPNLYYFVPDAYYVLFTVTGIIVTVVASLGFAIVPTRFRVPLTPGFLVLASTVSVAIAPFILPKMHDRYFFPADLLSIALGLCDRRLWFVPVLFQISSVLSYMPALSDSSAWIATAGLTRLIPVAVLINCVLVGRLSLEYWRAVTLDRPLPAISVSPTS